MANRSKKNPYPGINPHLNSFLQHKTGWRGFHGKHLTYLADHIEAVLSDAYYTANEESLQIGTYDSLTDMPLGKPGVTVPDVTIYRSDSPETQPSSIAEPVPATLTLPLRVTLPEKEEFVSSIVIYRLEDDEIPGTPVTRIELLSPANKPPGSYYLPYLTKRQETLHSGLRLVEIDYLHERRPTITHIPSYPDREQGAYPYCIGVSDPRPNIVEGKMNIYSFGVLDIMPIIDIPLAGADTVRVDFGAVYKQTFENSGLFQKLGEASKEPVNFGAYSEKDRERIRARMAEIANETEAKSNIVN